MILKVWSVETYGWDHGGLVGIYSTPEKARAAVLEYIEKKHERYKELYSDDPDEIPILLFKETSPGHWSNSDDNISIFERELQ